MRKSQLYVPGNREKMIVKAAALDCDSVILDLEDAVPPGEKEPARLLVARLSSGLDWGRRELCVRINQMGTPDGRRDVALLARAERVDSAVVPKAEGGLGPLHRRTGKSLVPLIETARGLTNVEEVTAADGVVAVAYGAADFALSVGGSVPEYMENYYVKSKIVIAARSNGVEAIDNVFFALDDAAGFRRQAERAKAMGYEGKQVIHPSQVTIANEVFTPSEEALEWARRVVDAYDRAKARGVGAIRVEGRLVDNVNYKAARRLLGPAE